MTEATDPRTPSSDPNAATVRQLVDSLTQLGLVWAQYGASVGQLALKTQSTWLRGLSTLLNQVADAMEPLTRSHATPPAADEQHVAH